MGNKREDPNNEILLEKSKEKKERK
jgi:hypothetical protein